MSGYYRLIIVGVCVLVIIGRQLHCTSNARRRARKACWPKCVCACSFVFFDHANARVNYEQRSIGY